MIKLQFSPSINVGYLYLCAAFQNGFDLDDYVSSGEMCSCHHCAPCDWCVSLTEKEVEVFDAYGSLAVNYLRSIYGTEN